MCRKAAGKILTYVEKILEKSHKRPTMTKQNIETTVVTGNEAVKRNDKRSRDNQKMTGKEGTKQDNEADLSNVTDYEPRNGDIITGLARRANSIDMIFEFGLG